MKELMLGIMILFILCTIYAVITQPFDIWIGVLILFSLGGVYGIYSYFKTR